MTHWVYTHIDAEGQALYVGCTNNLRLRLQLHASESAWFEKIADVAAIGPFEKADALRLEAEIIGELQPPHNIYGTDRDPRIRANRATVASVPAWYSRIAGGNGIVHVAETFGRVSLRSSCGTLRVPSDQGLPRETAPSCRLCIDYIARENKRMGRAA